MRKVRIAPHRQTLSRGFFRDRAGPMDWIVECCVRTVPSPRDRRPIAGEPARASNHRLVKPVDIETVEATVTRLDPRH